MSLTCSLIPGILNGGFVAIGPSSDGSSGQVLATNANGTLVWADLPDVNGLASEAYVGTAITSITLSSLGAAAAPTTSGIAQAGRANVPDANRDLHNLRRFSVTERLGVGTNNPATDVHIFNGTTDSNVFVRIQNDVQIWQFGMFGSTSDIFAVRDQSNSANPLVIEVGTAANTLYLDSASGGQVGIGNNNPQAKLHVSGNLIIAPGSSVTPPATGQLMFEATANDRVTVKLRGSDGTVRSGIINLS